MSPLVEAAIIAGSVGVLTLIGTVAVQFYGIHRTSRNTKETLKQQSDQLDRTLTEQRTRTLNERFATAADKLGSDKQPAVRLAGVYAMAGLADDWPKSRQTCVDILCGYLRLPYKPDPGEQALAPAGLAFRASREVRHTVIRVITAHLKDDAAVSWQGLNFDFTGVVFDGGSFNGAVFCGGTVDFRGAEFSGGTVFFSSSAKFSGSKVYFGGAKFSGSKVHFSGAKFSSGTVSFVSARFSGSEVFFGAEFSSGTVSFRGAKFSGGTVSFVSARFSGSAVDFGVTPDWPVPPEFPWTDKPPPGVNLPEQINPRSRPA
jgi:hypothetical protein